MTPDAVIYRYLQCISAPSLDRALLGKIITADADLAQRWFTVLEIPASQTGLQQALEHFSDADLRSIARVQASAVTPTFGSARLSLDLWQSVLRTAWIAEFLYREFDQPGVEDARLQMLLASSGVQLPNDASLSELSEYRGVDPQLLEDAAFALRVFAVVDSVETERDAELARQLFDLEEFAYQRLVDESERAADAFFAELGLADAAAEGGEPDWSHKVWLMQQVSAAGAALKKTDSLLELHEQHVAVSRSLFNKPPLLLALHHEDGVYRLVSDPSYCFRQDNQASTIAGLARSQASGVIGDQPDIAVVDRQLLRLLNAEEALITCQADLLLVTDTDDDIDVETAADLYLGELVQHLGSQTEIDATDEDNDSDLEVFKTLEQARLREIVHEANNPLSIVKNYLHILELKLQHLPDTQEQLQLISSELQRASEIIAQARHIPDEVKVPEISDERVDLCEILLGMAELNRGAAENLAVHLSCEVAVQSVVVALDGNKVKQILTNLIKNAVEASSAGTRVSLQLLGAVIRSGRSGVEISITDQAGGLPAAVLANWGQQQASSKGEQHQGIGLKVVIDLCRELDIDLDVSSSSSGTTFRLFFAFPSN